MKAGHDTAELMKLIEISDSVEIIKALSLKLYINKSTIFVLKPLFLFGPKNISSIVEIVVRIFNERVIGIKISIT